MMKDIPFVIHNATMVSGARFSIASTFLHKKKKIKSLSNEYVILKLTLWYMTASQRQSFVARFA